MVTSVNEFKLPDVGEGLTEAEIVQWHVAVGDTIKVNDPVCDIETAKSVVELPSPYAGVVQALLVEVGEEVQVGTPIIRIGDEAAAPAPAEESPTTAEESPAPAEESPATAEKSPATGEKSPATGEGSVPEDKPLTLVGYGSKEDAVVRRARRSPATSDASAVGSDASAVPGDASTVGSDSSATRVLAKPGARKLAKEQGIDLATVEPAREDGVVTTADLEALLEGAPTSSTGSTAGARERREPIKGLRKQMGQAMAQSAFTLPHATIWTTVDVTATTALVSRLKSRREFADVRVSPLLIVAKACLLAMRRTPVINSWWDEAAQEIVFKEYVNLGIAAATPRGLQVPNIKDADQMSLVELGAAINALTATARTGKTPPADQAGGTFTITNIGPFGIDGGAPIINPGESAILSLGAVGRKPWVVGAGAEERIEPRDVCTIALSFDHRHIDGESGSRFLADVATVLADPADALLF